jgi:hypothetical protein
MLLLQDRTVRVTREGVNRVHSAIEHVTVICTKLAGQRTAVLSMTVPHTVSESTDSHDQALPSLGPADPPSSPVF